MKLDRDKLIRAREMLGYGIETVAEEAGVSKNSVLRAEHGEDIRPLTARKIAAALDVRVADLYEDSDTLKGEAPPSQPSFNDVLTEERRELEPEVAGLFLNLAKRARLIAQTSRRQGGASGELSEHVELFYEEAAHVLALRRLLPRWGAESDELADAEDAYEAAYRDIEAMLRQDVEATDEERREAQRFRRGAQGASGHREADVS